MLQGDGKFRWKETMIAEEWRCEDKDEEEMKNTGNESDWIQQGSEELICEGDFIWIETRREDIEECKEVWNWVVQGNRVAKHG